MRILIVDDNQFAREGTIEYLRISNVEADIDQASNGTDAIQIASKNKYDIILLDISMPDISGIEVLKYIRSIDKDVVVIITSVVATRFQMETAKYEGVNDFLPKPIEMEKLLEWINSIKK